MNLTVCLIAVISLFAACNSNSGAYTRLGERLMEYQVDGDQYAVVVVMDGISVAEAKRMAKQRAAEITASQGDRYFTIDAMYEIEVIKSDQNLENQRFYGNMYQELIIEGDFNRERLRYREVPNTNTYQAIRLVFTMYKNRPTHKAIDACTLTQCN